MSKPERGSIQVTTPVICPNCRAEYQQASVLCSDCNAPLAATQSGDYEGKDYNDAGDEYLRESYREIRSALWNITKILLLFPTCLLLTFLIYITLDHLILRYYEDGLRAFVSPTKLIFALVSVYALAIYEYFKRKGGPSNVRFFKSISIWVFINGLIMTLYVIIGWLAQLIKQRWQW